jgi:hypothetical protein
VEKFGGLKSFPSEKEMTFKLSNYETEPPVTLAPAAAKRPRI